MDPAPKPGARQAHLTLSQVAEICGGRLEGDGSLAIRTVAPIDEAGPDELALLSDRRYRRFVADTRAGAFLVSEELEGELDAGVSRVVLERPHDALPPLLERLHPTEPVRPEIHPTAVLGRGVELGEGARIDPYAVLAEGVVVGDRTWVGAHVCIGEGAVIGADAKLYPHVVVYPGARLGNRVTAHAGARIGVEGFGWVPDPGGRHRKVPQVGGCVLEDDVDVGANTCIDRGSIGSTRVKRGTKLDNLIQIAHNVQMGEGCIAAAQTGIAGSTRVGRGVFFGGQAGAINHVTIGDGCQVGARSAIFGDVPAGTTVMGSPARPRREYLRAQAALMKLPALLKSLRGRSDPGRGGEDRA